MTTVRVPNLDGLTGTRNAKAGQVDHVERTLAALALPLALGNLAGPPPLTAGPRSDELRVRLTLPPERYKPH
eukprot:2796686-Alexandrium_andersonii.AAC.1